MFVRVAKFTKQIPTSPGWLSYSQLVEVLQQTLTIPEEMRDEELIGRYIFNLQLLYSRLSEIPSASHNRFVEDDVVWTTLSFDDGSQFAVVDSLEQMQEFNEARDELLAKFRVDIQIFPVVQTELTVEQLSLETVKSLVQ